MNSQYRPDIDGLRAIAVLAVALNHYGVTWLPGGFVGVDIFFVISGYLITTILKREMEQGTFSILEFYERRMRRILPALLAMLTVTLIAGWFLLMPGAYADLGLSASYAAVGFGNLFFRNNTGYFDASAGLQPLLHTWSLGVEEQFYFVWPAAVWLGLRFATSRRLFLILFAMAILIAFVYAQWKVGVDPKGAFYLAFPRAWELALGAFIAFVPPISGRVIGDSVGVIGLFLIFVSVLVLTEQHLFPGISALPACIGAALVVWPKPRNLVGRLLSMPLAVGIGRISYSLYLWHWPVLVFHRHYSNGSFPSPVEATGLLLVSLSLAYLSWRFVEMPFRASQPAKIRSVVTGLAAVMLVAVPAGLVHARSGLESRIPAQAQTLGSLHVMWQWDCSFQTVSMLRGKFCVFGATPDKAVNRGILWGDSHAEHTAPLLEAIASETGTSFTLFTPCPAALGGRVYRVWKEVPNYGLHCKSMRDAAVSVLKDPEVKILVIASSWNGLQHVVSSDIEAGGGAELIVLGLRDLLSEITRPGLRVVVVDQVPAFSIDPTACALATRSTLARKPCLNLERDAFETSIKGQFEKFPGLDDLARDFPNVVVVHPRTALCGAESCLTEVDGEFLYRDTGHFRRNLSPGVRAKLAEMLHLSAAVRLP